MMKFISISIENFRSFKEINVDLSNQNVIFGMNDVGKSNFLWALRFVFDVNTRKNGMAETDFFQNNIDKRISITICISIKDFDDHSQFLISKLGGLLNSQNSEKMYIQLEATYDREEEIGLISLFWGGDLDNLAEIPSKSPFSEIDKIFNLIYIDPSTNLDLLFRKYRRKLFKVNRLNQNDIQKSQEIKNLTRNINSKIGDMEVIEDFEKSLTNEYLSLNNEDLSVKIKSEMAIEGYFSDLKPYIKNNNDENLYPTSGEGRKKILSYSLLNYITKTFNTEKIPLYLIEEPENNLHRSLQLALSKKLFSKESYEYFFLTTHSPDLLYEMDNASLIRIYSDDKIKCNSRLYIVDEDYKSLKNQLNKNLSIALFSQKVLLVEGPSEKVLFEKVFSDCFPNFELAGVYILEINGAHFKNYRELLNNLEIEVYCKTDNDLRRSQGYINKFELLGFNRALYLQDSPLMKNKVLGIVQEDTNTEKQKKILEAKKSIYDNYPNTIEELKSNRIYLSRVDLENDLYEVIPEKMEEILQTSNPIKYLQNAKLINMTKLATKLSKEDSETLVNHPLFEVLKDLKEMTNFENS